MDTPLRFKEAQRYCRSQSLVLLRTGVPDDEDQVLQLLTKSSLKSPVWFESERQQKPTSLQDLSRQNMVLPGLSFTSKDSFARVNVSFPAMSAVSVCVRVQWDALHQNVSTVFSYAAPMLINEFQLRGKMDESRQEQNNRIVRLALLVQGQHHPYKAELPVDEHWHHVCVTWRSSDTLWAIYVDGEMRDSGNGDFREKAKEIYGDGIFILGQDQDTFGGTFTETFFGNLTDLNIWSESLELKDVQTLISCSELTNLSSVFRWKDTDLTVHHTVQKVSAAVRCPGFHQKVQRTEEYCEVFNSQLNWLSLPHVLSATEEAILNQVEPLEDRDIASLALILSRVAEMPTNANQSTSDAQRLSQSFVNIADTLISQKEPENWHSIREVVKGPMAVVQTVDRMMINLNSLLINDTDSVQIYSHNIKLQVQQKELSMVSEVSQLSTFCASDMGKQDCISVTAQDLRELRLSDFKKVTVLNTWYSSVNCVSESEENISLSPIVNDGYQRYMGTVLGSSLISTTVLADEHPISVSIHYTLQHKAQNSSVKLVPVCAFWDFDLKSQGGGWSTKGCSVISSRNSSTSCYCNHTTNFALLLQIYDIQREAGHETALQILGLIGSGISLCSLILTFILFVAVGVPKSDRTTVHKNLIVALIMAQVLLLFSDWAAGNQEACWLVTMLLHLFFLSTFCWMLVEGLLLWSKVVSVNISEEKRMKLYYLLGWGLPVIIVAVTLTSSMQHYRAQQHCWLNLHSHTIWAFAGPVLFILTVNAVVLFRVVLVTVSSARRRAKMLTPSSESKLQALNLTWAATRPVLILLPVLGLTWVCGVMVHLSEALAYLFVTLNAFQGLYIFLVYAVYNSEVRNAIKRIQDKRKALSFTNCSQPISFLGSQKSPNASWVNSLQSQSSRDSSENSMVLSSSLVYKNQRFKDDHIVCFSLKTASRSEVVTVRGAAEELGAES
ncbi:hypothetical protein DNTS_021931 [Danionella cerebrum]|nr:hypothetical protein DNTS_021931 [Danionella translucida]